MESAKQQGFIMRLYSLFRSVGGKKPTRTAILLEGLAYTYASERRECRLGYGALAERLRVSRATVARAVAWIRENGKANVDVKRTGGQSSVYTFVGESKSAHVRTEEYFCTEKFEIFEEERYLTGTEIDVLSLIYTHTHDERRKPFEGTYKAIANTLNISERSVQRAILALVDAQLIERTVRALNNHVTNEFRANMRLLRKINKGKKRRERVHRRANVPVGEHQAIEDVNAKAERERYYSRNLDRARAISERHEEQAFKKAPRLRVIKIELGRLEIELAKAELNCADKLPELHARKRGLEAERVKLLSDVGYTAEDLTVERWCTCQKCHDTGYLPNGRACNCYKKD